MGIISTLFSSSKTASKITDSIVSTGDVLYYTEEEKAQDRKKQREFFPFLLKAYEPFKIAQRVLAFYFSFLFGLAFIIGLIMECINVVLKFNYYQEKAAYANKEEFRELVLLDTTQIVSLVVAFGLPTIVLLIVAFYFSGGVIESFKKKEK